MQKVLRLRRPALKVAGGILGVGLLFVLGFVAADYAALNGLAKRINHASLGSTIR